VRGAAQDPPQIHRQTNPKGFTLVELIVVIVILGILLAIAIPALTGYIDKAEDKQYIAEATDAAAACRSVANEAYAEGTFGAGLPAPPDPYANYLTDGDPAYFLYPSLKFFKPSVVYAYDTIPGWSGSSTPPTTSPFIVKAAELMGTTVGNLITEPGYWDMCYLAPKLSEYHFFNAPAWQYLYFPEGDHATIANPSTGDPILAVTYGIDGIPDTMKTWNQYAIARINATFNSDVGYRVYHITR
jgi:prepilin-type N-terminal cleavage/methylation domain-containing protein